MSLCPSCGRPASEHVSGGRPGCPPVGPRERPTEPPPDELPTLGDSFAATERDRIRGMLNRLEFTLARMRSQALHGLSPLQAFTRDIAILKSDIRELECIFPIDKRQLSLFMRGCAENGYKTDD